jgi:hypothetical protein
MVWGMGNREIMEDPGHETQVITAVNIVHNNAPETATLPPSFATSRDVIIPLNPPAVTVQFPSTSVPTHDLENPPNLIERRHLSDVQSIIGMLKEEFILYWNSRTSVQQCTKSSNFSLILRDVS